MTSGEAASYLFEQERELQRLRDELEVERRERARLEKQLRAGSGQAESFVSDLVASAIEAAGVRIVTGEAGEMDASALLDLSDRVKQKAAPAAVVLAARGDGSVHLVANFSDAAVARGANASEIVKTAAAVVGGGGGGRPAMARAGGRKPEKIPEALAAAADALRQALA